MNVCFITFTLGAGGQFFCLCRQQEAESKSNEAAKSSILLRLNGRSELQGRKLVCFKDCSFPTCSLVVWLEVCVILFIAAWNPLWWQRADLLRGMGGGGVNRGTDSLWGLFIIGWQHIMLGSSFAFANHLIYKYGSVSRCVRESGTTNWFKWGPITEPRCFGFCGLSVTSLCSGLDHIGCTS